MIGIGSIGVNSNAASSQSCLKNASEALEGLAGSGYNEEECKLTLKTSTFGVGFGVVGEADAFCKHHVSAISVDSSYTRWSVHFAPGSCQVLSIAPISAPPSALAGAMESQGEQVVGAKCGEFHPCPMYCTQEGVTCTSGNYTAHACNGCIAGQDVSAQMCRDGIDPTTQIVNCK